MIKIVGKHRFFEIVIRKCFEVSITILKCEWHTECREFMLDVNISDQKSESNHNILMGGTY